MNIKKFFTNYKMTVSHCPRIIVVLLFATAPIFTTPAVVATGMTKDDCAKAVIEDLKLIAKNDTEETNRKILKTAFSNEEYKREYKRNCDDKELKTETPENDIKTCVEKFFKGTYCKSYASSASNDQSQQKYILNVQIPQTVTPTEAEQIVRDRLTKAGITPSTADCSAPNLETSSIVCKNPDNTDRTYVFDKIIDESYFHDKSAEDHNTAQDLVIEYAGCTETGWSVARQNFVSCTVNKHGIIKKFNFEFQEIKNPSLHEPEFMEKAKTLKATYEQNKLEVKPESETKPNTNHKACRAHCAQQSKEMGKFIQYETCECK